MPDPRPRSLYALTLPAKSRVVGWTKLGSHEVPQRGELCPCRTRPSHCISSSEPQYHRPTPNSIQCLSEESYPTIRRNSESSTAEFCHSAALATHLNFCCGVDFFEYYLSSSRLDFIYVIICDWGNSRCLRLILL